MNAMAQQKGLGRGLGALLGDYNQAPEGDGTLRLLPLQRVEPNPDQPRRDFNEEELQALADSIATHGMLQPLTVREISGSEYYQIIAGERRWRAARLAGLTEVPALVVEADDRKAMELALIENLQRQDLNPVEEALGYQSLLSDYGLTQEEAAQRVGKSRPAVANALRLLNLDEDLLALVRSGKLSPGHARAVLSVKDPKKQLCSRLCGGFGRHIRSGLGGRVCRLGRAILTASKQTGDHRHCQQQGKDLLHVSNLQNMYDIGFLRHALQGVPYLII